jgi:dolichol-phosphate mannosyltransferase
MTEPILELSIVVPTFNERDNIAELVRRLDQCLTGTASEIVFVDDDAPDRASTVVQHLAQADYRVRCVQRIGRRGLSSACIEGMLATSAPFLAVMDADLQHDERRLPQMLNVLRAGPAELVISTRYADGGAVGSWDESRDRMSRIAAHLSRMVCKLDVSDPMSGFFVLRRDVVERVVRQLSGMGFKILLDILASSPEPIRVAEVPYHFGSRFSGESKLDSKVLWEYGMLLADKLVGKYVPVQFV